MNVGERIRSFRDKKGIEQIELANRVGISQSKMNKIETGFQKRIEPDILVAIAEVLGTTTDYLLGKSGSSSDDSVERKSSLNEKILKLTKEHPNLDLMFDGLDQMDDETLESFLDRIIEMIEFENYRKKKK